jgi:hypothetical protein
MKKGPDALDTAKNESGRVKQENGTRRPRYREKRVQERKTRKQDPMRSLPPKSSAGAQDMKTRHDALSNVENQSERAKHENRTRRPPYSRKRVRARKT